MNKIIVVNDLDRTLQNFDELTKLGKKQVQAIFQLIKELLDGTEKRIFVYTSKHPWACTAGDILADALSAERDQAGMLTESPDSPPNLENIRGFLGLIGNSVDIVILIGLATGCRNFCEYYAREEWHELGIAPGLAEEGNAYVLDCEQQKIYFLTSIKEGA